MNPSVPPGTRQEDGQDAQRPTSTTSFTWFRHRLSNAVAEGLNSKIQTLESAASGFHSFASYRVRILFFCGGLDMAPANSRH